ncbi:MAG TPA: FAD-binding oxidoreductase [Thermoleophilaceae bacterium]|jgi:FAD/FMN-containing dehydrogenase|nr:FAD-binding oxidoreductase [Thermoleophilaceae bacterium]
MSSYISSSDPDYDDLRSIWNAMHDKRPALIARCSSADDVVAAIGHARANDLTIAVRSGGHSLPGHSTCDGGLVIDLRPLNRVMIDPYARRAHVQAGALLGDVDRATQAHGLVVPAGVISHTGVAGLTLGGGVGRLMRRFGLTIDSLLAAEVVTADGRILEASENENPDLFWALRGGGGNFGVVTRFDFRLHELSELPILAMFHEPGDVRAVLQRARDVIADRATPDELLWTSFLRRAHDVPWMPPELVGRHGLMSLIEWSGDRDEGMSRLSELQAELDPAAADLSVVPFLAIQTAGDEIFGHGKLSYIKATFADDLTDDLLDALLPLGNEIGSYLSQVELLSMGGAISRVDPDATAFPHRGVKWLINIPATWDSPDETEAEVDWVRRTYAAVQPHATGGAYVNFMDADEESTTSYGTTMARLQAVKAIYDPKNVFRLNQNIEPVAPSVPASA